MAAAAAAAPRVYVDFVPQDNVVDELDKKSFVIDLSKAGFKKEQLRVQIDSFGRLRISGERQLNGNRWSRFRKDLRVPEGCNAGEVRAKFEKDGFLHIIMPKLSPADEPKATATAEQDNTRPAAADQEEKRRAAAAAQAEAEEKKRREEEGEGDTTKRPDQEGGEDGAGRGAVAPPAPATRPAACGKTVWTSLLLLCVVLALLGAGLYAQFRVTGSAPAPADDHFASLSEY